MTGLESVKPISSLSHYYKYYLFYLPNLNFYLFSVSRNTYQYNSVVSQLNTQLNQLCVSARYRSKGLNVLTNFKRTNL